MQKSSKFHDLIVVVENIRKNLDEYNIGCRIFADPQKAFDTVEHDILISQL